MKNTITVNVEDITRKIVEVNEEYQLISLKEVSVNSIAEKATAIGKIQMLDWLLKQK